MRDRFAAFRRGVVAEHGGHVPRVLEHPTADHGVPVKTAENQVLDGIGNTGTPGTPDLADWLHDYEERAAIREHDGGLPRHDAERLAYEETLLAWHHRHGMPPKGTCGACGQPLGDWTVPLPDGAVVHTTCVRKYHSISRTRAAAALTLAGVPAPIDNSHTGAWK
ncbi:hypothetical protein [Caenispirillum bisanense]|uniref:Uncharacterized protein n=1 Tax=Caenispirillum bisanense TaxID=414052 RepID=A0A286H213_9PROT|nr:hypothetical protein [Caenispirillum bisanense]SOE01496.1 hypothetical protein SAMN05421508_1193 [Caenispirillum bisanense]